MIGAGAGIFCYFAVFLKEKLGYDDSLDVFAVHGVGGTWGAIATGLFANPAVNPAGTGLFFGNAGQLAKQLIAVGATWVLAIVGTYLILKIVDLVVGLRVGSDEERIGLDLSQHNESAYGS
jgi:Amt family ammonium transporter